MIRMTNDESRSLLFAVGVIFQSRTYFFEILRLRSFLSSNLVSPAALTSFLRPLRLRKSIGCHILFIQKVIFGPFVAIIIDVIIFVKEANAKHCVIPVNFF